MSYRKRIPSAGLKMQIATSLGPVTTVIMLFMSIAFSGCATDKAAGEISKVARDSSDLTGQKGEAKASDIQTPPGIVAKDMKDVTEGAASQAQPSSMIGRPHAIKPSSEMKPLLAVMQGKDHENKGSPPGRKVHVELAFDNANLYEVLDVTLYELFKVDYMVDPSIKAKVTFHLSGDFTRSEYINVLNNVMQLNNLSIVKGPGDIYKIVRRETSAGSSNAPLAFDSKTDQAGDITRMIRLRYLSAATAAKNIRPFLSRNAVLVPDEVTNSLMITDTSDNLDKAVSILGMMDVEYFTEISWQIFPIKETDALEMAKDLSQILKAGGLFNRPGIDQGSFEILPIKTMNALLVVTRWPAMLKLIHDWINAMDHADNSGTNVFVYFVENGTAAELADILIQLYGGTVTGSSKKLTIVKPAARPGLAGELSGEVEIIPDETNNAIVFKANGRDYKIILEVLKRLDIVPRQVLINVVIAEITLSGSLEYGVQWFLKDSAQSDYKVHGVLDQGIKRSVGTALGTGSQGLTVAVFDSDDLLRGLVSALESEGEVNILSSPNILAVDNKESKIEVAEQIPLPTGETTTDGGTTVTSIQYRDTGVLLTVTPHINSSGLVKMELSQEVSELGTEFVISDSLTANSILNRKAETSLVVEDGQTIFLGGLMRSKLDKSGSGIPFLRRIPLLGYAFGGKSKKLNKTELIFMITPRVVKSRAEADAITREFSHRVEEVKKLVHRSEF